MAINVISDFDQTLIKLSLDWKSFRATHNLNKVIEIWSLPLDERNIILEHLTQLEIEAALQSPFHPASESIFRYSIRGILSNNSEKAIQIMLDRCEPWQKINLANVQIVGREKLNGPKENKFIFQNAIKLILNTQCPSDTYYIGDATYEIQYAQEMGLRTTKIMANTNSVVLV